MAICHGAVTRANLCITGMLKPVPPGSCEGDGQTIGQIPEINPVDVEIVPSARVPAYLIHKLHFDRPVLPCEVECEGSEHDQWRVYYQLCSDSTAQVNGFLLIRKLTNKVTHQLLHLLAALITNSGACKINSLISVSIPGVNRLN